MTTQDPFMGNWRAERRRQLLTGRDRSNRYQLIKAIVEQTDTPATTPEDWDDEEL